MRDLDAGLITLLRARRGLVVRLLLWVTARNRTTGDPESVGFCSDVEPITVTIGGGPRTYLPAGGLLRADPMKFEAGAVVRMQGVTLSGVHPDIEQVLRGYDPRLAPVELHRMILDPETNAAVGTPVRLFQGYLAEAPIRLPEKGGAVSIKLTLASSARDLTRGLTLKKSDESQQRRSGDRFRRWVDVSGEVDVFWGANRYRPVTAPPATVTAPEEPPRSGSDR